MARGDAELACLNRVRQQAVKKYPMGGHMLAIRDGWFGLHDSQTSENDPVKLGNIIMDCVPNQEPNKFPDFVFPGGFIEHFRVSASDRGNKGFESMAKENQVRTKSKKKLIARNEAVLDANPSEWMCISGETTGYRAPEQGYDVFCESFRKHWEKHIGSLRGYDGQKDTGVFLIECPDPVFFMAEDDSADYPKPGVHMGDLRKPPEKFRSLRLSRCPDLLEYMYGYRSEVQYVIYVCQDAIEIFRTDELQYIKSLIRHPYLKYDGPCFGSQYNVCVTMRYEDPVEDD